MTTRILRCMWIATAATVGLLAGCVGGSVRHLVPRSADYPFLAERAPLPHHVPQHAGGLSLRYAMVHDVIHERLPKHGTAHYRERNRVTTENLATLVLQNPATFPLADDLASGLERLARPDDAVAIMRDKLARQQAKGLSGRDLYSSHANLGTFLVHANAQKALTGDPAAKERFREGVELVRKSVGVNPEAHFGRERWQVAIASPVGPEEWFVWVPRSRISEHAAGRRWAWGTLGAGLGAILAAGLVRWRSGRTYVRTVAPHRSPSAECRWRQPSDQPPQRNHVAPVGRTHPSSAAPPHTAAMNFIDYSRRWLLQRIVRRPVSHQRSHADMRVLSSGCTELGAPLAIDSTSPKQRPSMSTCGFGKKSLKHSAIPKPSATDRA